MENWRKKPLLRGKKSFLKGQETRYKQFFNSMLIFCDNVHVIEVIVYPLRGSNIFILYDIPCF